MVNLYILEDLGALNVTSAEAASICRLTY